MVQDLFRVSVRGRRMAVVVGFGRYLVNFPIAQVSQDSLDVPAADINADGEACAAAQPEKGRRPSGGRAASGVGGVGIEESTLAQFREGRQDRGAGQAHPGTESRSGTRSFCKQEVRQSSGVLTHFTWQPGLGLVCGHAAPYARSALQSSRAAPLWAI